MKGYILFAVFAALVLTGCESLGGIGEVSGASYDSASSAISGTLSGINPLLGTAAGIGLLALKKVVVKDKE